MKTKKRLGYVVGSLLLLTLIFGYLAQRDITRIYGGLTAQVDPQQFQLAATPLAIKNVQVLAPDGERFIANQTVYMADGLIVAIEDTPSDAAGHAAEFNTIDGQGKYLMPGLTDAHVHLWKSPNDLLLYVANGVTQVRELAGTVDHLELRQQVKQGRLGPDLFVASTRIGSFGFMEGLFMAWTQGFLNINNAKDAVDQVKDLHQQGYDAVKIYSHINPESYAAVTNIAKSLGMQVVGHVPFEMDMASLYPIQDEISHLEEIMNALNREFGDYSAEDSEAFLAYVNTRSDEVAKHLYENGVAVTTTLWLVESFVRQKTELEQVLREVEFEHVNPGISEWSAIAGRGLGWLPGVNRYEWPEDWSAERRAKSEIYWSTYAKACQVVLKNLIKHQVTIMAGTDANITAAVPGFSMHDELISMKRAGMSTAAVLRSATSIPAAHLNNNAGQISAGRKAHLVLLDKNPLDDISHTKAINAVVLNGKYLDRAFLDRLLQQVKQANDSSRTQDINKYIE